LGYKAGDKPLPYISRHKAGDKPLPYMEKQKGMSVLVGEYRNHPLCPVASPCVPCPVVIDVEKAGKSANRHPVWVSCHSCHCCPNLIALRIRPDNEPPVEVKCRAAQ